MTQSITYTSTTPNYSLPFLFAGQAQKEFFVNHSYSRLDVLVHTSIAGRSATPSATPDDGESWLIAASASGDWLGLEEQIATWIGTEWSFVQPRAGMRVYDQQAGQMLLYDGTWQSAATPETPQGGTTIDAESRQAITEIITELRNLGIFARS